MHDFIGHYVMSHAEHESSCQSAYRCDGGSSLSSALHSLMHRFPQIWVDLIASEDRKYSIQRAEVIYFHLRNKSSLVLYHLPFRRRINATLTAGSVPGRHYACKNDKIEIEEDLHTFTSYKKQLLSEKRPDPLPRVAEQDLWCLRHMISRRQPTPSRS